MPNGTNTRSRRYEPNGSRRRLDQPREDLVVGVRVVELAFRVADQPGGAQAPRPLLDRVRFVAGR
jgi:hypothetical protein